MSDVDTRGLVGWGEWAVGQITPVADWFKLRWVRSYVIAESMKKVEDGEIYRLT